MTEINFILNNLHILYDVPIRCFRDEEVIFKPDPELPGADPLVLDKSLRDSLFSKWDGFPFLELENGSILYGVCKDMGGVSCIIGPVAIRSMSGSQLYNYKNEHNLLSSDFKIKYGSVSKTAVLLALLHREMNHVQVDFYRIIERMNFQAGNNKISDKDIFNYTFQSVEQNRSYV